MATALASGRGRHDGLPAINSNNWRIPWPGHTRAPTARFPSTCEHIPSIVVILERIQSGLGSLGRTPAEDQGRVRFDDQGEQSVLTWGIHDITSPLETLLWAPCGHAVRQMVASLHAWHPVTCWRLDSSTTAICCETLRARSVRRPSTNTKQSHPS